MFPMPIITFCNYLITYEWLREKNVAYLLMLIVPDVKIVGIQPIEGLDSPLTIYHMVLTSVND